jgi:hypothetical protein
MATSELNPAAPSEPSSAQPANISAANGANQNSRVVTKHLRSNRLKNQSEARGRR